LGTETSQRFPRKAVVCGMTVTKASSSSTGYSVSSKQGLTLPAIPMSVCQTSPRLGFGMVLSFHFFKKGETLRGDMITDGQVVGFGLKAQHFETNLPSFGIRKLRKFFKDFGKAHADTLAGMVPGARS
jgi:hypothetical protein